MPGWFHRILLTIVFAVSFGSSDLVAQIKTNVQLSNPYATQAKALGMDLKAYRKLMKDSLRNIRKLDKLYKDKIDSLVNVGVDDLNEKSGLSLPEYDSGSIRQLGHPYESEFQKHKRNYLAYKGDSIDLDSLITNQYRIYEQQYLDNKQLAELSDIQINAVDSSFLDSLTTYSYDPLKAYRDQKIKDMESKVLAVSEADQLIKPDDPIASANSKMATYQSNFDQYKDRKNLKANMQKLAGSHIEKYGESLQKAHESMAVMKKKYVSLPSLEDLSLGVKRNSLKGQPLGKRLKIGGNLHIRQSNTIDVDFSPSIAYRLNRRWSSGLEGMYRSQFGGDIELSDSFNPSTYGIRAFTEYLFYKGLFIRSDVESLHKSSAEMSDNPVPTPFLTGALAGVGKSIKISKGVSGKVMVQYNFLHEDNGLYSSPWVVRFGFDLKSLSRKKVGIGSFKRKST